MRLPTIHPLLFAYIDKLRLRRRLFHYIDVAPASADDQAGAHYRAPEDALRFHRDPPGQATPPPPSAELGADGRAYLGRVVYEARDGAGWFSTGAPAVPAPEHRGQTWILMNGRKLRKADYARDPRRINDSFSNRLDAHTRPPVDAWRRVHTGTLLDMAYDVVRRYIRGENLDLVPHSRDDLQRVVQGWARVLYDFDDYSLRRFLREEAGLTVEQIDAIGSLENLTSRLPLSFLHSFLGRADINPDVQFWELEGGSWRLPYALASQHELWPHIHGNRALTDLWMVEDGAAPDYSSADVAAPTAVEQQRLAGCRVVIRTVTESTTEDDDDSAGGRDTQEVRWYGADTAIIMVPFSALRFVRSYPAWSYGKRRAIQELHYDAASKVLLEFDERWWEFDQADWLRALERKAEAIAAMPEGDDDEQQRKARQQRLLAEAVRETESGAFAADHFVGGGNVSDNANRFMYFPSHRAGDSAGGVVLASYTWADDARRWDSVSAEETYKFALRGLMAIHGQRIGLFWTERGAFQSWMKSPYAFGEAAVFAEGQFTELHPHIPTVEGGVVHFAGEHTSLKHAWIEAAIESGIRAAKEVHEDDTAGFWQAPEEQAKASEEAARGDSSARVEASVRAQARSLDLP